MSDPLADALGMGDDPYGKLPHTSVLIQLINSTPAPILANEINTILKRLVVLEMYLEEKRDLTISKEELESFIQSEAPRIEEQLKIQTTLFFGSISKREGG
ncbi:hypothetical protein K8I28_08840 [bacterium]|nr:hypothetical protein [bacterium]